MKKYICLILLAFAASSCIYPFELELDTDAPERLVVYGDILIGEQTQIDLSYVLPLTVNRNTPKPAPPKARVYVENSKRKTFPGVAQGKGGTYLIDTRKCPSDARYRLVVELNDGRTFTTPWADVNQEPDITDVSYTLDDKNLYLQCSMQGKDTLWNFCWDYDELWEYHAYFIPDLFYVDGKYVVKKRFMENYYCWNNRSSIEPCMASAEGQSENRIENYKFLTIPRTDDRLSHLYSITLSAKALTTGAKAYLEHQAQISNGTGDLFSPVPSEMRGNIRCVDNPDEPAIGYVSVCKRSFKRIFVGFADIYKSPFDPESLLFYPEPDESGNYNLDEYFRYSSPVSFEGGEPNSTNVKWGSKMCTDCRAWGGTKTKPEWWPNDDK